MNLICPTTLIILLNGNTFLSTDVERLERHKAGCVNFYPQSPCLKKWIKVNDHHVNAICGPKEPKVNPPEPKEK